jgi:hypothetical protein
MSRRSPPRHRHDGTSPLPLGMDASPPPSHWNGAQTKWPHDSRSGWSYCAFIPSWVVLPEAKAADGSFVNPIVVQHCCSPAAINSVLCIEKSVIS